MKYRHVTIPTCAFLLLFNILFFNCLAQEKKVTISGIVDDLSTGETLIGATVLIKETGRGTVSNTYGFYSLTLPPGDYTLRVSFLGYADLEKKITVTSDQRINFSLLSKALEAKEVVITGNANKNVQSTEISKINLDIEKIKALPAFLGEVDLIKTIQLLPGVMSAGEGNSGLYIRGGGPDQNLIMVDEAVVYNAAHLFGFFSIFNADAVKNVELIKGGMPAQYGGRLASVLDINLKEGNNKEVKVDGGIGLIASRLTIQGPIQKEKSSFIVSARRTYIDVVSKPFISKLSNAYGSGYYFYDLNGKLNYQFSEKDQLYVSGYFGRDVFSFIDRDSDISFKVPWGNATATARWNHLFSEKLFANTTFSLSDYNFQFESKFDQFKATFYSGIRDYSAKVSFNYYPSIRHQIKFGASFTRHIFTPNIAEAESGDTKFNLGGKDKIYAHESGFYVSDDMDITDRLRINGGLRLSIFAQVGPFTRYVKDDYEHTAAIINYGKFDNIITYGGLEPRVSVRFKTGLTHSIKAAYTRNFQYVQIASVSPLSLPTDIWIPSSSLLKPQLGNQYNLGYFRNFENNRYETSVELYYKDMSNLIEYKEGVQPDDNLGDNVDNNLTTGTGQSYGLELFLKKVSGDFNGWIGYTLSKTTRRFPAVNEGRTFPAKYDRRHDLSVALTYDLSARWSFGSVFIYGSGNTITLPIQRYYSVEDSRFIDVYGQRNGFRMGAYHRLDLSATLRPKNTKTKVDPVTNEVVVKKRRIESSWNFSVYNVYSRQNPYFLYNDLTGSIEEGNSRVVLKQVSLFPILPSVTWNFSF